jgi:peptidoglycan hydrolase-like protein with peptidoglycan-binding domain
MVTSKKSSSKKAGSKKGAAAAADGGGETPAPPTPAVEVASTETLTVTVLRRGARGPEVETMQNELVDLGYLRRAQMATGPGIFGPVTEEAVKHLQRDNFLAENGTYDEPTQEIIRQVNAGVGRGSRGNVVRGMQNRLVSLGLMTVGQVASGPGIFGPQTEEALKMFQRVHGIDPNGVLTDETYQALLTASPAPVSTTAPAPSTSVDTVLPAEGRGFTTYRREPGGADQFGRASTIRALLALGEAWAQRHDRPRIQIGDISRRGGGPMAPHSSHQRGIDVDMRPMRSDGAEAAVRWDNPAAYSRALTREMVQLIRANNQGVSVFFNDPTLISEGLTRRLAGHDDHLHVRFG